MVRVLCVNKNRISKKIQILQGVEFITLLVGSNRKWMWRRQTN